MSARYFQNAIVLLQSMRNILRPSSLSELELEWYPRTRHACMNDSAKSHEQEASGI